MNRTLLAFYERELERFQRDGAELSHASNRASALQNLFASGDPFVTQVVQALAYTLARLEVKASDEKHRVPDAMLQFLHPMVCRPFPARTIVQFQWGDGDVKKLGHEIHAGTRLSANGTQKVPFETACNCILPPIELKGVSLVDDRTSQRLRLQLESPRPQLKLGGVELLLPPSLDSDRRSGRSSNHGLRLFLGGVEAEVPLALYHALTRAPVTAELVMSHSPNRRRINDCVRAAGFDSIDSLLPTDARHLEPMRILAEYAVMREKFLFVDIVGLHPRLFAEAEGKVALDLILDPQAVSLLREYRTGFTVRVGCVPVINLEETEQLSVPLHRTSTEIPLRVDPLEQEQRREVFSVDNVHATSGGQTELEYVEMFSPLPIDLSAQKKRAGYFHVRRVPQTGVAANTDSRTNSRGELGGNEVLLSLVEFDPTQTLETGRTLHMSAKCLWRDVSCLATHSTRFENPWNLPAQSVTMLHPPVWPKLEGDAILRLVKYLSCGEGLLQSWGDERTSLRQFLSLFEKLYKGTAGFPPWLSESFITELDVKPTAAALPEGIARGIALLLTVAPGTASIHEAYLLVRVLDVAISAFCSANGFTRLKALFQDGHDKKVMAECPARTGKIALI